MRLCYKLKGFSYLELMITLAILVLLASIAMPLVQVTMQRSKEQELMSALRQIRDAIDAYKKASDEGRIKKSVDSSGYPPNLSALVYGVEDVKDPKKHKIFFLRKLPIDPMVEVTHGELDNWGKRSYQSPPDNPQEGDDVFDIYSTSSEEGLNGVPYREW